MARVGLRRDLRRREVATEPALYSIPTQAQTPARYILVSHSLGDPRSTLDCFREKSPSAASSRGRSSWDTVVPPERERERERERGGPFSKDAIILDTGVEYEERPLALRHAKRIAS